MGAATIGGRAAQRWLRVAGNRAILVGGVPLRCMRFVWVRMVLWLTFLRAALVTVFTIACFVGFHRYAG